MMDNLFEKPFNKEIFDKLYDLDLSAYKEQLYNKAEYISWANAYRLLIENDSTATYKVLKADDGLPFFSRGGCHMVFTEVTAFGQTKQMHLAIMNNKFKAIENPTGTDVSNSIMRCLVKNIALFGIGLSLYAKDDPHAFKPDDSAADLYAKFYKLTTEKEYDENRFMSHIKDMYDCNNIGSVSQLQAEDIQALINILNKKPKKK